MHEVVLALALLAEAPAVTMKLTSTAFTHQGAIPARLTCDGTNVSPPLAWSDAPAGTKSFALIVDDPDARDPKRPEPGSTGFSTTSPRTRRFGEAMKTLPPGTLEGANGWGKTGGGPCPPIDRHRYAPPTRSTTCSRTSTPHAHALLAAMDKHVLASVELIGTYQRP
jgi:phosphatidylethanolamine-binding protein (PEBP) family uncharacterized protein